MNIYERLTKDHETLKALLNELEMSGQADSTTRSALIDKIRDELVPHSRAEEAVLYNSLREVPESKDLVMHSYAEHMQAETLLRSLQVMDKVDMNWQGGVSKLRQAIEHHIADEESRVFPAAQKIFSVQEADMLGAAFGQMKPQVREGSFLQNTIDMVVNMMPERLREPLKRFATQPQDTTVDVARKAS